MNPYLLTLTFLTLMSILTSSQVVRFSEEHLEKQLYKTYHTTLHSTESARAIAALETFREEPGELLPEKKPKKTPRPSSKRRAPSLKVNRDRPPNSARLNLHLWLYDEFSKNMPLDYREVLARLIRTLYDTCSFYTPNLEYALLDHLTTLKEEMLSFTTPDELATLELDDPELQTALIHMLKGAEGCPSLLNYITFDKIDPNFHDKKKVNLLFADSLVIEALLPSCADKLLALRDAIWLDILDQEESRLQREKEECKTRTAYKKELLEEYKRIVSEEGLPLSKYTFIFDLSLGKVGTVLLVHDPKTGLVHRQLL